MTLADAAATVLEERGPLPTETLARKLGKRTAEVRAALRADPRFTRVGSTKGSRWELVPAGFSAAELAARWHCSSAMAEEILFGDEGFAELGIVASLNGNGRVVVTELGLEFSAAIEGTR